MLTQPEDEALAALSRALVLASESLPRDARLTRQNAPEYRAIQDADQECRAQCDRGAIHQTARHEEAEPAEDIRAVEFTPSRDGDSPVLPDLLGQNSAVE